MNKNIEWLKEEVFELYPSYDVIYDVSPDYEAVAKTETISKVLELIDQLDEPDKSVIPKFVADWIEVSEKHYSIGAVFHDAYDGKLAKVAIEEYIFENQDLFAQAWLDGYEVEKEKKYYVLDNKKRTLLWKYPNQVKNSGGYELETVKRKEAYTLTEKEIKDYDERFWQFAVPVEEEAE